MKRNREELEQNLEAAIDKIKHKRKQRAEINKILSDNGITSGTFDEVIKNNKLNEIELSLLCLFTDAVFQVSGEPSIRTEDYFTSGEIEESKNQIEENKDDIQLPIIIKNVMMVNLESYLTVIDVKEIVKWYNSNIIVYDYDTQRSPTFLRKSTGVVPVPTTNPESINAISKMMLENNYLEDMMTINVYSDEFEPVIYNPKTKQLTIKEGTTVSILDGYHRLQAAVKSVMLDPNFEQPMILSIRTYDTDTAKKFFGQINSINPVKKERIAELKQEKVSYAAVKYLQMSSDLKGRIASGARVSEIAGQWTTADILANAIEEIFEPKNTFEAKEAGRYLSEFFTYLIGMFDERLNSRDKDDLINHPKIFIGYIYFAKVFKDEKISLKKIREVIDKLDVTTNNQELSNVILNHRGNSSRLQKKVREYFEKIDVIKLLEEGV